MTGLASACDAIGELLGAYVVDALDESETAAVEAHLAECPRCAQEVDAHRETVGLLAASSGDAPDRVWNRIAGAIEAGPGPLGEARTPPVVHPAAASRTRRWPVRALAAAALIAAAVAIGIQTVRVNHLDHQVSRLNAAAQQQGALQGAAAAVLDPSAKHLVLTSTQPGHQRVGQLVILPSGAAYIVDATMARLPASRTYQLWSLVGGRTISTGLLGNHPTTVAFHVDPGVSPSTFLVSVEPAGGVVAPTSAPVAQAIA